MDDSLNEFALNKNTNHDNYLAYKNVRFPVKIFDMESRYDSLVCRGQVIDVPEDSYRDILFVATAQFGYKEDYLSLVYSDGETEKVEFTLSDWCERVLPRRICYLLCVWMQAAWVGFERGELRFVFVPQKNKASQR